MPGDGGYEEARAISEAACAQTAIRDYPERAMETQELAHAFCAQAQLRSGA
jgi:hypothetical protein